MAGLQQVKMYFDKAAPSSLKNHHIKNGNCGDSVYICHVPEHDAIQDLMKAFSTSTMIKVVLLDQMESNVYVFTDSAHEQFLAHA